MVKIKIMLKMENQNQILIMYLVSGILFGGRILQRNPTSMRRYIACGYHSVYCHVPESISTCDKSSSLTNSYPSFFFSPIHSFLFLPFFFLFALSIRVSIHDLLDPFSLMHSCLQPLYIAINASIFFFSFFFALFRGFLWWKAVQI